MGPTEPKSVTSTKDAQDAASCKDAPTGTSDEQPQTPYSVLSERERIFTICISSMTTFLTPVAANMYLTALGPLARDMHVSDYKISLTITIFKIVEAIAPLLPAGYSDRNGRRPLVLASISIYFASNIGLALQDNYAALFVLRCLQAFGSSSLSPLSFATVADLVPRAERGRYMFYSMLGMTVGPAIGPILGGVLTQYLGWRSIFWFLTISAGVLICAILLFLRETCRAVVGNGSVPPQSWNRTILQIIRPNNQALSQHESQATATRPRLGIIATLLIVLERHVSLLAISSAVSFGGTTAILTTLPILLERKYGLNSLQIGLCFLTFTLGAIACRWNTGILVDRNYKRHARMIGANLQSNQELPVDQRLFPIEKVRLELTLPFLYLACLSIIAYGWLMEFDVHLAAPLIVLFVLGNASSGTINCINNLAVDLNPHRPAATIASMNTAKHLTAAGAVAAAVPLIDAIGIGWTATLVAALCGLVSLTLWVLYAKGQGWRQKGVSEQD
ncbi:major facilitator superfamily domain-containing protein [Aspergillus avenaceus]|uniref:Major facilitator superfamily domain-containing protein n=1 Tax=Aspergillus avenaceus TaxID=36643 RepID=A0A5N6U2C3_ASPAV|nr:major facilitator superfamily domain-containing protein [Aspergillus avenaceus]